MKIIFLGTGQDAGVPQIGCYCINCTNAREHKIAKRLGPSLALLDESQGFCYLFDASPDIKDQVDIIRKYLTKVKTQDSIPISGIFLTHAHYGHIAGLWSLGKECIDAKEILIFCSNKMSDFLKENHPFQHMFERSNLSLFSMKIEHEYPMENFRIKSFKVPHRDEHADTVGYHISATKEIIYLPDLDNWTDELIELIDSVDIAIIDGSFYQHGEISGLREVPHPPIVETIEKLDGIETEIIFSHFNHTNPILSINSKERKEIEKRGFKIAEDGMIIEL